MLPYKHLQAIVFDWAGTMIDHGSRAPAAVFEKVFREYGVPITAAQAREPMGMAKRDHLAAGASMPAVAEAWRSQHGKACTDADIDRMYDRFLPLQKSVLMQHAKLIDGAIETVEYCRSRGLKIGSSTGYTQELMETVSAEASKQGYTPDIVLCAEDAPRGRPAPYLIYLAAVRLQVYPLSTIVKVDDTTVGIEAGRNAGCWTVGITRTGNCVGLSEEELDALSPLEVQQRCAAAEQQLLQAGAHYVTPSVRELPPILDQIEQRMATGELPPLAATHCK